MIICSYEKEYSVLHSGTNNIFREGDDKGGHQLEDLSLPTTLSLPTQTGSIKGNGNAL